MQAFKLLAFAFVLLMLAVSRGDDASVDKPKDDKKVEIPPWWPSVMEEGKTSKRSPKEWYEWIYDNPITRLTSGK
ncbi:hypothetical protein JTE90_001757 [Oedothorax gibbosus]|uniref:Uncharacterized protein n=1 Tax=Oedothorax gibbosus TaxID=931172 RepID=A0AAV6VQ75_9ARAC|nr:hypothetical protein JTE90_001757 [Oedothorax gibbosus]